MIRLMLVEDHEMVRAGFRMLLEAEPDLEIVAEADSGDAALELLEAQHPDVILLDISMPGMSAAETVRTIKARLPSVAVLVVTIHETKAYLLEMLDAGADGYLPKSAAAGELVTAIRTVHAGRSYIYGRLVGALVEGYRNSAELQTKPSALTPRQLEVLRLVADGLTSQKVADRLGLSARTVDRHIENMMKRLQVHSRIELVKYAIREGLVRVSDL